MSVWSWLKLTVSLWLLRKAFKQAGWLLLAAPAVAAWPVTLVAAAGSVAAWRRGWPPVGCAGPPPLPAADRRLARGRAPGTPGGLALAPVQDWAHGWPHLTAPA